MVSFDIGVLWEKLYDEVMGRGFKGLRVVGEMFCFFEAGLTRELLEYERSLHHRFEIPIEAVCAYNTEVTGRTNMTELLLDLILGHCRTFFHEEEIWAKSSGLTRNQMDL